MSFDGKVSDVMKSDSSKSVVVIGGGPAGLTAAYELQKRSDDHVPLVLEGSDMVGGISRTESHKGYRFDIGGHRFFTKVKEVEDMWTEVLEDDFITVPRSSRIYYRNRFFDYPLKPMNALGNIGLYESFRIILSYFKWKVRPYKDEQTFEEWVINRFGGRLYMHFFRSYTEKVWGISPREIRADWAAQRIKNLSLWKAVWNAFSGSNDTTSLIEEFRYPRLGPGMMWEKCAEKIEEKGGEVRMRSEVVKVHHEGNRVTSIDVRKWSPEGRRPRDRDHRGRSLHQLDGDARPCPRLRQPARRGRGGREQAQVPRLPDRDAGLNSADPFPDNWIYIHSPDVKVGRIQNFRAWSEEMVPDPNTASIGMEYFCNIGDDLWEMSGEELHALASKELAQLGLATEDMVLDSAVIRQPKAYPVYDGEYMTRSR